MYKHKDLGMETALGEMHLPNDGGDVGTNIIRAGMEMEEFSVSSLQLYLSSSIVIQFGLQCTHTLGASCVRRDVYEAFGKRAAAADTS